MTQAQTITISHIDNGTYTPGSSLAVKVEVSGSGCIKPDNIYTLYLSDASGNFASKTAIGTFTGFYTTFVNGVLPTTVAAGSNYRLQVSSSSDVVNSNTLPLNVAAGSKIISGINGTPINSDPTNPVFGACNPAGNYNFNFNNDASQVNNAPLATGAVTEVTFFNEMNQTVANTYNTDAVTRVRTFNAANTNYTVLVTTRANGVVGTRAYMLINNVTYTNFGSTGTTSVCLGTVLTFNVDYQSATGIQNNFPGNFYTVSWGDGKIDTYTLCDIKAAGGKITHEYTTSSCGHVVNGQNNVFQVDLQAKSPYCSSIAAPVTSYAKVSAKPLNKIATVLYACTNTPISFGNLSNPGEDPNNTSPGCIFSNAKYSWFVDGDLKETGYSLNQAFNYTFPAAGTYRIRLQLENNPSTCPVTDDEIIVCVQNKPQPSFTLPDPVVCLGAGDVTPTRTFTIDNSCYTGNKYTWTVTPDGNWPAAGFAPGTNANSVNPSFRFTGPGIYKIGLTVTDACGGTETAVEQRLVVNNSPTVTLQPDVNFCGFTARDFADVVGSTTRVRYGGTPDPTTAVYAWTVVALDGQAPATFTNGTQQSSEQYPRINFPAYGRYRVSAQQSQTGACGTSTIQYQTITIQQAPAVNAGNNVAICASDNTVAFTGTISDQTNVTSFRWLSSSGGTFTNGNTLTPTYILTAGDKLGGNVTITLDVNTNLAGVCSSIKSTFVLNVTPTATVTPPATPQAVCTGSHFRYDITSPNSANYTVNYNWTATASAGISGFGSSGSGAVINDDPINSNPTTPGTITYTITPTIVNGNGQSCTGTPYQLVVTVNPLPVLTPIFTSPICSGQPVNITLNANLAGTRYTWASSITSGLATGNQQRPTATTTASIQDVIINTGTTDAIVTYTITPVSATGCQGTPFPVNITINPQPSAASAGTNQAICNETSYTLNGNIPAVGIGTWTEASGLVTFVDNHSPNTVVNNLVPGRTYQFTWTIANQCGSNASTIQIINNLPSSAGTASTTVNPICAGTGGNVTLTGTIVGTVTAWQQLAADGVTWVNINGALGTTYTFPPLTETTTFRALVQNGSCSVAAAQPVTVTVNPPTPVANAGADQELCNQTTVSLSAVTATGFTGQWTQTGGPAATIVSPGSATTSVTGLAGGNIYNFRWTVNGKAPCPNTTDDVVINNLAPVTNTITPPPATVCSGATIAINGSLPTGGTGTYTYMWESSADNGATWTTLTNQTSRNATVVVTSQVTFRRTVISNLCSRVSNQVSIGIQASISNNVINGGNPSVCFNTAPNVLNGTTPTGGGGAYSYTWEQSTNAITFSVIAGATQQNYQPGALTATTTFRRIVSTALCAGLPSTSNTVTVVVNPNVSAFFTATKTSDCAPFIITSQMVTATADPNANKYTWFANNVQIGTGLAFPGYRIDTDGETISIKLQVESASGCNIATYPLDFTTRRQVTASFTANRASGCGPTTVAFTNTSTPVPGTSYFWDFGDGNTSTEVSPTHTFQPRADGRDAVYNVILIPDGCLPTPSQPLPVTVYPLRPVATITTQSTSGCGPYVITVDNLSPGTNKGYLFRLFRGNAALPIQTIPRTDKTSVSFAPQNPTVATTFWIDMVATNNCDQTTTSDRIPITVTPSGTTSLMNVPTVPGCAPLVATFKNYSTGGSRYEFTIYNANGVVFDKISTPNLNDVNYTFNTPGVYTITVTAYNDCSPTGTPSTGLNRVTVYESPVANFSANTAPGCKETIVKFTNSGAPSFNYEWDFGDGTTSTDFEPTHTFNYAHSPYTVTLKASNNSGCSNTQIKTAYIVVNPPPFPEFTADPGFVTAIPNYHFQFNDRSTGGAVKWDWNFGDGKASTSRNPSHTYADTGRYVVKLTTTTSLGCTETITHEVQITGVPGQLYVPNAFMPSSGTEELRRFTVKGAGLKQWRLRIFDNWGQMVFETTRLNEHGEPVDFWDGTFRGQPVRQGAYAWEISASFINGQTWRGMSYKTSAPKRSGTVTLLR